MVAFLLCLWGFELLYHRKCPSCEVFTGTDIYSPYSCHRLYKDLFPFSSYNTKRLLGLKQKQNKSKNQTKQTQM